ncbi:D-aminoacyl-tRNA deacylase [Pararhodobacter oceanensis]|uniref:D-aminoacyl-tRNA deacylase n=1 Tax=Pararhodobacter oceanensis TaxID=2172121 RepID=A0A2T8HWD6_9RHOB|nr:D-aminoacyl-tRNA deacylase [Pararhodobacter oceanensis]PVH29739.1 D-tyrosyl-tRNA(Tyr) deacylase [Pararhodobacter oceanensis]
MRALIQRVTEASVSVDGAVVGETGPGLLILVCAMQGDDLAGAEALADKVLKLRIFRDESGKTNRSLADVGGGALVVSQFTLAADTSRGNRPGFSAAAAPEVGRELYEAFADRLAAQGVAVGRGQFGAEMQVALVNDGPMTIWLDP